MKYPFTSKRTLTILLVLLVLISIGIITRISSSQQGDIQNTASQKKVALLSVDDFASTAGNISANGTVESLEQVELRSQSSGPVARIYTTLGAKVARGQILVALQNADLYAQAAQAAAGLKAQEARLLEMRKGLRTEEVRILENTVTTARDGYEHTKRQQDVLVQNAHRALLSTGLTAFANPGNTGSAVLTITGSYESSEEGEYRIKIYNSGVGLQYQYSGLELGDGFVSTDPQPLGHRGLYIQFSTTALSLQDGWTIPIPNKQSPLYVTNSALYQTAVVGRAAAIDGAKNALAAAEAQLALRRAGASQEQFLAQEAAVDQAKAALQLTNAQIEKTITRSPISGIIAALPVTFGELISPGQVVASVVNPSGIKVKAYFSVSDVSGLQVGNTAMIDKNLPGHILAVAPSLDPVTKTIEVAIGVDESVDGSAKLIPGQNVTVDIPRTDTSETHIFVIPLQAVRISQNSQANGELGTTASVLTVTNEHSIVEVPVKIGMTFGESVEIREGLTPGMRIVATVYELAAGQKVDIQE